MQRAISTFMDRLADLSNIVKGPRVDSSAVILTNQIQMRDGGCHEHKLLTLLSPYTSQVITTRWFHFQRGWNDLVTIVVRFT
jgi:hypothetical protein